MPRGIRTNTHTHFAANLHSTYGSLNLNLNIEEEGAPVSESCLYFPAASATPSLLYFLFHQKIVI